MRKIIKYQTFGSSKDFEKWQAENEVEIYSISPYFGQADVEEKTINIAERVFVTYADVCK